MSKNNKSNHQKYKNMMNKSLYKILKKEKKIENKERLTFLETVSETLKIPQDVLVGAPLVSMIGKYEVCIENYKGIIEYNTTQIKILTKIGRLQVDGKNLEITYFTNDEMKINGIIHNISYMNEK